MTKKSPARNIKAIRRSPSASGCNLLLALTLVPIVIGVLLIGAWVLDISIFDDAQSQIIVGILFILLGFAASNILQKRWRLAAGWGLLMCADLVLLAWLNVWAQAIAIGFGLVGLIFLGIEFYRQYRQGQQSKLKKEKK
jgi:membrane-bound ClpP family serine protease